MCYGKNIFYDDLIPPLSDFGFKEKSFSKNKGDFYDMIETMSQTASLTNEELHEYHQWLKVTNDDRLRLLEAESQGRKEEKWENARNLFKAGVALDTISIALHIPLEELKAKLK